MNKDAGFGSMIGKLFNRGMIAGTVKTGLDETDKELNHPVAGKTDVLLHNKPVTPAPIENAYHSASEFDGFEKSEEEPKSKIDEELIPKAVAATLIAAAIANAIVTKHPFQPIRTSIEGLKKLPGMMVPKALSKYRYGRLINKVYHGIKEGIKPHEIYKQVKEESKLGLAPVPEYKPTFSPKPKSLKDVGNTFLAASILGGGFGLGNLATHILGDKYLDRKTVRKSFDTDVEPVTEMYHFIKKEKATDKYKDNRRKNSNGYNNRHTYRSACEFIDQVFEKTAVAGFSGPKHYLKKILVEDVAQNAVRSLPYFVVPAAASMALGRDLRYDAKKLQKDDKGDRIVIDVPLSDIKGINKTAQVNLFKSDKLYEINPWKNFAKVDMPSSVVKSLTWALPATALAAVTGRNFRGAGEKINSSDMGPVGEGKARITIETGNRHKNQDFDPTLASEIIEEMYKEAELKKNEKLT